MTFATYTYEHQAMLQLEQMAADQQDSHLSKQQQEDKIEFLGDMLGNDAASGVPVVGGGIQLLATQESMERVVGGVRERNLSLDVESALQVVQEPEMHSMDSSIDIATQMALEAVTEAANPTALASTGGLAGTNDIVPLHLPINDNATIRSNVGSIEFDTASSSTFMQNEYQTFTDPTTSIGSASTIISKSSRFVDDIVYSIVDGGKYQCPREGCGKVCSISLSLARNALMIFVFNFYLAIQEQEWSQVPFTKRTLYRLF